MINCNQTQNKFLAFCNDNRQVPKVVVKSLLVLQNFTIARKSGNIALAKKNKSKKQSFQYAKAMFPLFRAKVVVVYIQGHGIP